MATFVSYIFLLNEGFAMRRYPIFFAPCILIRNLLLISALLLPGRPEAFGQCGVPISVFPYFENFESGQAGWSSGGTGDDWAYGTPAKGVINTAASGTKCWVTGTLTGDFYTFGQRSYVESPCFNFTLMNYPYVRFKIWWESEQRFDGTNFQYSLDAGATWNNVGSANDPVDCLNENWYNQAPVTYLSTLANPRDGWSGNMQATAGSCLGGSGSNGWVEAKHCMPYLANKPSVKFRFTFGAGTTCNNFDGVAFDDVYIGSAPAVGADFFKTCAGGSAYNFTDLSINCPDTWTWNFGDPASGAANTSTLQNPSHTFSGPGVYQVSLKASNGCSAPGMITQTVVVFGINATATPVDCNGASTGTATATLTQGGMINANYVWSTTPQQFSATAVDLPVGVYTVTVTNAGTCPATATVTITQPPALQHVTTSTPAACGNPTGSATVTASGGTGPYSYQWTPAGGANATASNLAAGNYIVSITDQNGCKDTASVTVGALPALQAVTASVTPVTCNGGNNGSATVSPVNGAAPFTYTWPGSLSGATQNNLAAGAYTVTVTDANSCTATTTVAVNSPPPFTHQVSSNAATCGGADGSASITQSGGTAPYTFSWPSGAPVGNSATGLSPGNYIVTVLDQAGCTDTVHVSIGNIPGVAVSVGTTTPATCFGGSDGSITVNTNQGLAPYTFAWSPTGGNAATANGLSAGTYTVTVTDANHCTATATAVISQAPEIQHTVTSSPAACGANNGTATIVPNGGLPPYNYNWSPTGGNGATASNLASGIYIVSITDQKNCLDTAVVQIGNLAGLTASISNTVQVSCFGGNNASATVSVNGGTAPFTYAWSPAGGSGPTASGLPAGLYNVQITDANNCVATASIQLTQPTAFQHSVITQPVTCNSANGSAVITANGGTGNYTYVWSAGGGTSNSASNLAAGNYIVTISDQNNCKDTLHFSIGAIAAPQVSISASSNATCFGSATGSAAAVVSAGTAPFSFTWGPTGGNGSTATGLTAGAYTVTVTDGKQCTATASVTLTQPPALAHTVSVQATTCGKPNGNVSVTASGGAGNNYSYAWTPPVSTGPTASDLPVGYYVVKVTDVVGCTDTIQVTVPGAPVIQVSATVSKSVSCFGGQDGSITTNATSGLPPYSYAWAPASGGTPVLTGLAAGVYTVSVTDANQCTRTATATITEPPALDHSLSSTEAGCNGVGGSASITPSGGTSPYQFAWSTGSNGGTATGLNAGAYTVTVTDAKSCTEIVQINIGQAPGVTASVASAINPTCFGGQDGSVSVSVSGGTQPFNYVWSSGIGASGTSLPAGEYSITVTDAAGCTDVVNAELENPEEMRLLLDLDPVRCSGGSDAVLRVDSVIGGLMPYQFALNGGAFGSGSEFEGLNAGTYTVQVQDAAGCFASNKVNIEDPAGNSVEIGPDITIHLGEAVELEGVLANPVGGLQYAWTPAEYVDCADCIKTTGTPVGNLSYTLVVTDPNGCTVSDSRQIRVLPGSVYIPNVIAPAADAPNDYFTVFAGSGVEAIELLQVYDRWGDLVFENRNFKPALRGFGWDGTFRGEDAPAGVYAYYVKIRFIDGSTQLFKGDVTVLR